jgi:3-hydroxybutyryl-CoA dehydrogenase
MTPIIKSLLVIGTGTMGRGIAQVAAGAGLSVRLYDSQQGVAEQCRSRIEAALRKGVEKGFHTADQAEAALGRLIPVTSLAAASEVEVILEAVKEDLNVKQDLFLSVEELVGEGIFFWTNTSMLSVSEIAKPLRYPGRLVGTHFFNPVPRMKLVEVIAGRQSSPLAVEIAEKAMGDWGKVVVRAPDSPGFIVNRVFDAIKREALAILREGVSPNEIDTAVRLGLNFPMGPFEVMDLVGLDTTLACLKTQAGRTGRSGDFGLLDHLVEQGNLGRKTGRGFYGYEEVLRGGASCLSSGGPSPHPL